MASRAAPRGTFWVAVFTVRNPTADWLAPQPFLRECVTKLPESLWPAPAPYGMVIELDGDGNVLRSFQDPGGLHVSIITSVHETAGQLLLGTLLNDYIGRFTLPETEEKATEVRVVNAEKGGETPEQ